MSHGWYTKDGKLVTEVVKADGSGFTAPTVRHARKNGWKPRFSSIADCLPDSGGLEKWIREQYGIALMHCIQTWHKDEPRESLEARFFAKADEARDEAANLGSTVHAAADAARLMGNYEQDPESEPARTIYERWAVWHNQNINQVVLTEKTLVEARAGGTVDEVSVVQPGSELEEAIRKAGWQNETHALIDLKTRRVKSKSCFRAKDPLQHAFYRQMVKGQTGLDTAPVSAIFNSITDHSIIRVIKVWTPDEMEKNAQIFDLCFRLWSITKNYDPTQT